MPRPHKFRFVGGTPTATVFKPAEIPARTLEMIQLRLDELEAVRLADLNGLYQEQAAQEMRISRATFGRLLEGAHHKIAEALLTGKGLMFQGGTIQYLQQRIMVCNECGFRFPISAEGVGDRSCPSCQSMNVQLISDDSGSEVPPGPGRRGRGGRRGRHRGGWGPG